LVAARFRDSEIQRFSEMSKFQKFYLYCAVHDSVFDSLQAVAKHRRDKNENPRNVKIICGECGELFRTMEDLAKHCNVAKFANRVSTIKNYNKHSFDYKQHFQFITRQSSVSAAAARARNEETAKPTLSSLNQNCLLICFHLLLSFFILLLFLLLLFLHLFHILNT